MVKKEKWSKDQNPVLWHKKERHTKSVVPHVERWIFNQLYDYAMWLHKKHFDAAPESDCMYKAGNVLKGASNTFRGMYVMAVDDFADGKEFLAVDLAIGDVAIFIADDRMWELSSLQEAANAE